jgi:hypothetical protein
MVAFFTPVEEEESPDTFSRESGSKMVAGNTRRYGLPLQRCEQRRPYRKNEDTLRGKLYR